jgi:hypothetical protein
VISAFRQQPINEGSVDAVGRKYRFGDALRRVLVEIEAGGTECKIKIGNDRIEHEIAGDGESHIVGDRRGADAAFRAHDRDDAPDRLGVRRREQAADRAHGLQRAHRRDQIIADAAPHQFAIERDVVHAADDDHARL